MLAGPSAGVGKGWPHLASAPDRMYLRLDRAVGLERRLEEDWIGSGVAAAKGRGVGWGWGGVGVTGVGYRAYWDEGVATQMWEDQAVTRMDSLAAEYLKLSVRHVVCEPCLFVASRRRLSTPNSSSVCLILPHIVCQCVGWGKPL